MRFLLIAGSIAVAVLLFRRGQLTSLDQNPGVVTLLLVGGFLLGVAMNAVMSWWRNRGHRTPRLVEDVRALLSVAAAGLLIFLVLNRLLLARAADPDRPAHPARDPSRAFRPGACPRGGRRVLLRLSLLEPIPLTGLPTLESRQRRR